MITANKSASEPNSQFHNSVENMVNETPLQRKLKPFVLKHSLLRIFPWMESEICWAGVTQMRQTGIKTPYAWKRYLCAAQMPLQFLSV